MIHPTCFRSLNVLALRSHSPLTNVYKGSMSLSVFTWAISAARAVFSDRVSMDVCAHVAHNVFLEH